MSTYLVTVRTRKGNTLMRLIELPDGEPRATACIDAIRDLAGSLRRVREASVRAVDVKETIFNLG